MSNNNWIEKEVSIKEIKNLLDDYEIEVDSPDGWVKVTDYIDKGIKQAWKLEVNGREVLSSGKHLYETQLGWEFAECLDEKKHKVLCDDGEFHKINISQLFDFIRVVDIRVDHKNHRYFTNGVTGHNTNLGKSLIMSSLACNNVLANKNVLYITCEMSRNKIAERVLANIFDIEIGDIKMLSKDRFFKEFENKKKILKSKLYVEEFPPNSINANHIRNLLKELKVKRKFIPDIIYVDYLEIMSPIHRYKADSSYLIVKRISEEVRAISMEIGTPIVSAVQSNREGFGQLELDLTNISQSIGTAATADIIIGVTQTEELRNQGKYYWMLLKNRYGLNKKTMAIDVNYFKMRVFENDIVKGSEISDMSNISNPLNEKEKTEKEDKRINDIVIDMNNFIDDDMTKLKEDFNL